MKQNDLQSIYAEKIFFDPSLYTYSRSFGISTINAPEVIFYKPSTQPIYGFHVQVKGV